MLSHKKTEFYFLLVLLLGIFILTFFIFKPFLYALILALIFTIVFGPVHKKILILTRKKSSLSALLTTLLVLLVIVAPLTFLGMQISKEATSLYSSIANNGGAIEISRGFNNTIQNFAKFSSVPINFSVDVSLYLEKGLSWFMENLSAVFSNVAKTTLGIFIFLIALYYLFKDGLKLKEAVVAFSPLKNTDDETIFTKLSSATNSVVKGTLLIALIQGILTAIGFIIFGIPNATLWGSLATITALIPSVGTAIILLPSILYLFSIGNVFSALGLLIWGIVVVGLVDNLLRPKLIERGIRIHPFLILLSTLGGISLLGPIGFLLGPIILSLLAVLFQIYLSLGKEYQN